MTAQRKKNPRYIVGIPSSGVLYEGESKLRAWATWLIHRKSGAQAYDRLTWVIAPSYWLHSEHMPEGVFNSPSHNN